VGERVIARRNDRAQDLDNGMRGTITALDEHRGATIRLDTGATRHVDPEYLAAHVEHAYALTGHAIQGGTVEWAGVMGQPHDFSRNWAYTALSRGRQPVELFLVDERAPIEQEREEIAPVNRAGKAEDPVERMARRMRERDDEDLALEQLEHPQTHDERAADTANRHLSPARAHLYEVRRRLKQIHQERDQLPIQDAKTIVQHDDTITAIKQAHERDRRPQGWRDRLPHKTRKRQRELHIEQLRDHQAELLETTPDPRSVLERAEKLNDRLGVLIDEALATRAHAIADELATRPPWLERTLGAEPPDHEFDRDRWQQTAREIAGHRIDHHITDPHTATHPEHKERELDRSIAETRAALGLDRAAYDHDLGYEL
jgi:hypothetical protein